jgi:hypothetical protein
MRPRCPICPQFKIWIERVTGDGLISKPPARSTQRFTYICSLLFAVSIAVWQKNSGCDILPLEKALTTDRRERGAKRFGQGLTREGHNLRKAKVKLHDKRWISAFLFQSCKSCKSCQSFSVPYDKRWISAFLLQSCKSLYV